MATPTRTNYTKAKTQNMDSSNSNSLSPLGGPYSRLPGDGGSQEGDELNRAKIHLEQVTKKNQDLEEKLLQVTQELEKERKNSRAIVLTLTERLMELKETINKLEIENMRYKKDCMLTLELLQCNRTNDQARVSSAMKKLSDYSPKPQASKNEDKHPTNEEKGSQSTTNETPFKGKGVFQRPKLSRAVDGKAKSELEKVASVNTTPTREKGPPHRAMHVNEASRLMPEESPSVRDNAPLVDNSALSEQTGSSTKEGVLFAKDKPRLTEGKQSVPSRPRGRGQEKKYTPLMQDNIAIKQEDTSLVEKETSFGGGGNKVLEKPTEILRKEVTPTYFSTQKEQALLHEDKLLSTLRTDKKSSLEDEHAKLIKEERLLKKLRDPLTNVDTPLSPKAQSSEAAFDDTPLIVQDNLLTKAEPGLLTEENKPTAVDDDRTLKENEELFDGGGATEVGILKEGEESSTDATVLENGACTQQGKSVAEDNDALPGALLAEDGKLLTEEVGSKPLAGQALTKDKYEDNKNAPTEKETEDDMLAEEDTPLV